jgi:hypothetical protein
VPWRRRLLERGGCSCGPLRVSRGGCAAAPVRRRGARRREARGGGAAVSGSSAALWRWRGAVAETQTEGSGGSSSGDSSSSGGGGGGGGGSRRRARIGTSSWKRQAAACWLRGRYMLLLACGSGWACWHERKVRLEGSGPVLACWLGSDPPSCDGELKHPPGLGARLETQGDDGAFGAHDQLRDSPCADGFPCQIFPCLSCAARKWVMYKSCESWTTIRSNGPSPMTQPLFANMMAHHTLLTCVHILHIKPVDGKKFVACAKLRCTQLCCSIWNQGIHYQSIPTRP